MLFRKAYAFEPQATVADAVNQGMVEVEAQLPRVQLLLHLHDALYFQYLFGDKESAAGDILRIVEFMSPTMEGQAGPYVIQNELRLGMSCGKALVKDKMSPEAITEWVEKGSKHP